MSITRLQQARQMFQFGGGADMGASSGPSGPPGGGEGVDRPTMADIAGPVTGPTTAPDNNDARLNYITNDYLKTKLTPTQRDTFDDYRKEMAYSISPSSRPRNRIFGGLLSMFTGIPGAGYGLGKVMDSTAMGYNRGTTPTNDPDGTGGGDGIMDLYSPNIMDISGEVVTEDDVTGGGMDASMSDFIQRFRGLNETRQDKQGQLDPAIIAMINRLYT